MSRCNAYTINPKKCKIAPSKGKEYCRYHSKYNNSFLPVAHRSSGTQTEPLIKNKSFLQSMCVFLFYLVFLGFVFFGVILFPDFEKYF